MKFLCRTHPIMTDRSKQKTNVTRLWDVKCTCTLRDGVCVDQVHSGVVLLIWLNYMFVCTVHHATISTDHTKKRETIVSREETVVQSSSIRIGDNWEAQACKVSHPWKTSLHERLFGTNQYTVAYRLHTVASYTYIYILYIGMAWTNHVSVNASKRSCCKRARTHSSPWERYFFSPKGQGSNDVCLTFLFVSYADIMLMCFPAQGCNTKHRLHGRGEGWRRKDPNRICYCEYHQGKLSEKREGETGGYVAGGQVATWR